LLEKIKWVLKKKTIHQSGFGALLQGNLRRKCIVCEGRTHLIVRKDQMGNEEEDKNIRFLSSFNHRQHEALKITSN
jgi:hypothetical protein